MHHLLQLYFLMILSYFSENSMLEYELYFSLHINVFDIVSFYAK